ncbi:MAG TPA: hypothetical protein VHO06_20665 [Polyangia bacterium]|nr:hypothetical protein [Polyangia bacterium]
MKALLDRERTVVTVPAATRARVLARAMACVASGPPLQRREDESLAERRSILSLFFKKV